MSEWQMLLAVFWAFYALNGFSARRRSRFHFTSLVGKPRARTKQATWSHFRFSPFGWRMQAEDVPFSFSPAGITNLPVGSTVRPVELPLNPISWAWDDIEKVAQKNGYIWINSSRFTPATGHLSVAEIKALAALPAAQRTAKIEQIIPRWFRPHRLRRLHRMVSQRTELASVVNLYATILAVAISVFLASNGLGILSKSTVTTIAHSIPAALITVLAFHGLAIVLAWINNRRMIRWGATPPSNTLFSVALFPPQALQLRAILADAIWPATHPLTAAVAFAAPADLEAIAGSTWRDLQCPLPVATRAGSLSAAITSWHRAAIAPKIKALLQSAGIEASTSLTAPPPDSPASCAYCPRCHDQFVRSDGQCPHGIKLTPLHRRS
jgi:cytochrome c553